MKRFIEGLDRNQTTLLPECMDGYVDETNPSRAIDAFVDILDLAFLGFDVEPEATGRPGYHPATMLKLYLHGYLNQVQRPSRGSGFVQLCTSTVRPLMRRAFDPKRHSDEETGGQVLNQRLLWRCRGHAIWSSGTRTAQAQARPAKAKETVA